MKITLPLLALASLTAFASCKKIEKFKSPVKAIERTTNSLKVPVGFTWENSRNVHFAVNVSDTRYGTALHMISIYNGDPKAGGILLTKGSASNSETFISRIYLSKQILAVYIVKTSPDNSTVISKVAVGTADVVTTMGK